MLRQSLGEGMDVTDREEEKFLANGIIQTVAESLSKRLDEKWVAARSPKVVERVVAKRSSQLSRAAANRGAGGLLLCRRLE